MDFHLTVCKFLRSLTISYKNKISSDSSKSNEQSSNHGRSIQLHKEYEETNIQEAILGSCSSQ